MPQQQPLSQYLKAHFSQGSIQTKTQVVDEAQLRRAVLALRVVAPNAIRSIETLIPLLYPEQPLSFGQIQYWLTEAQERAEQFNSQVDLAGIQAGALDEMFSQCNPVLTGVDLDSGYLFGLEVREHLYQNSTLRCYAPCLAHNEKTPAIFHRGLV